MYDYYVGAAGASIAPPKFRFTVVTAAADTFQLPIYSGGTYNFYINWGDGESSIITAYNDAAANHSYAGAGTYNAYVFGTLIGWRFNNVGDKTLIGDISEWGQLRLGNSGNYFYGCSNLTVSATDALDLIGTTSLSQAFQGCTSLTTITVASWNVSAVTTFYYAFEGCGLTTIDISGWNTTAATTFEGMFANCTSVTNIGVVGIDVTGASLQSMFSGCTSLATCNPNGWTTTGCTTVAGMFLNCSSLTGFDPSGATWNIQSLTAGSNFLAGATALTTAVYDATLIAWQAQIEQPNVTIHFGTSKYTGGGTAATARAALVSSGWTITDGGIAP